ncbi:alpha/beta hydrolase fold-domain-containing protein [Neohortaea acidophila]|uniref:Alpha/beta hydrolase fold-domain-containing protein n=1 Tax=Neohortaea acidophila TaxID=245834 RepID=A0A6A6PL83_9PEZI|nr:alpha/beta hydrolase fold-domain-containing protein [Neohortaea acidophila]KAF2480820.1 alpha/beta hydrolase fold-domain-containing protein [Neohortaea acidophila]
MGDAPAGVKEHDEQVKVRDGTTITCRIYSPEKPPQGGSPLVVIYHGGGWCIGGLENEELLCRRVTSELGATAVNVDYRLGPEHKFPAAHDDCYDATKWALDNASRLGADPTKGFVIGGTSAGGNITATIAHQFRDDKITPGLTGCLLMIPAWCAGAHLPEKYKSEVTSPEQNKNAPILSQAAMDLFTSNYISKEEEGNPIFSPLLWKTGHANLPASYFQICGQDPLRDEALIAERILREEGVKTKVEVYPGQPHGFHSVAPTIKGSKKFVDDSVKGVKWLLEQK